MMSELTVINIGRFMWSTSWRERMPPFSGSIIVSLLWVGRVRLSMALYRQNQTCIQATGDLKKVASWGKKI